MSEDAGGATGVEFGNVSKRRLLAALGTAAFGGLAGCSSGGDGSTSTADTTPTDTRTAATTTSGGSTPATETARSTPKPVEPGRERWSTELDGLGAAPAVQGTRVFVNCGQRTYGLAAADGTTRWTATVDGPSGAPVVSGSNVFVGAGGGTFALDPVDGGTRWRSQVTPEGLAEQPAVTGDGVFVTGYGRVARLAASDGDDRWGSTPGGEMLTAPVVEDGSLYAGSERGVYALATTDGSTQWTAGEVTGQFSLSAGRDQVFMGGENQVVAVDAADGTRQWSVRVDRPMMTVLSEQTLYVAGFADGVVYGFDVADGSETLSFSADGGVSRLAVGPDTVYAAVEPSKLTAIDGTTGSKRWTFQAGSVVTAPPALGEETIYVGTEGGTVHAVGISG